LLLLDVIAGWEIICYTLLLTAITIDAIYHLWILDFDFWVVTAILSDCNYANVMSRRSLILA